VLAGSPASAGTFTSSRHHRRHCLREVQGTKRGEGRKEELLWKDKEGVSELHMWAAEQGPSQPTGNTHPLLGIP